MEKENKKRGERRNLLKNTMSGNRNNINSIGCDDYCTFNTSRNNNKLSI